MNKSMAKKTITEVDAQNFPVLTDFVGKSIEVSEYRKAVAGEKFTIATKEKAEVVDEVAETNEEAEVDAEVEVKPKGKGKGKK